MGQVLYLLNGCHWTHSLCFFGWALVNEMQIMQEGKSKEDDFFHKINSQRKKKLIANLKYLVF